MSYKNFLFSHFRILFALIALSGSFLLSGCGYSFQNSKSPLFYREGIRKIYIDPIINNSYKAGIENVVYNDLVRNLTALGRVVIVQDKNSADAILTGVVSQAGYGVSGSLPVSSLSPSSVAQSLSAAGEANGTRVGTFGIASWYLATLTCSFSLNGQPNLVPGNEREAEVNVQAKAQTKAQTEIKVKRPMRRPYSWTATFNRTKPFPASNQLDVPGTTSPLINDTEFDRALAELSKSMIFDVHEAMVSMF